MLWRHVVLSWLLHLVLLPLFALRPKLRAGWRQRFFWRAPALPTTTAASPLRVWAHGASAGDVLAIQPLLDALAAQRDLELTITALTDTGVAMARQRLTTARALYQPYDLPGATRRAVEAIQPQLLLLERAELWPALIRRAHAAGALVAVVNTRIAESTVRGVRWLSALAGHYVDDVDLWLVRDDDEAGRVRSLGVPAQRVHVTGNTKLDAAVRIPDAGAVQALGGQLGITRGDPVIVAGSTHHGEEELVLQAFAAAAGEMPAARLVLAPRYLDRCDEVQALVQGRGLALARRSLGGEALQRAQVVLLDTLGELGRAYGLARVAFVGGSLVPRGGQNMLEPASQGVPVLCGPHTEHSRDQVALLQGQGLQEVADVDALAAAMARALRDPDFARAQGALARAAAGRGTGAAARCAQVLLPALDARQHSTS